jgi:hypothetical protein
LFAAEEKGDGEKNCFFLKKFSPLQKLFFELFHRAFIAEFFKVYDTKKSKKYIFNSINGGETPIGSIELVTVLCIRIRIRPDPKLFAS